MNEELIRHYDALIQEQNDPVLDSPALRAYMDLWDGEIFLRELMLHEDKSVLEIGVGTGRLAVRVAGKCRRFVGIDVSPWTAARATEHLHDFPNVSILCGDFLRYGFTEIFDVIYSSLTFFHIREKSEAVRRISSILNPMGRVVLSLSKDRDTLLRCGDRLLTLYPDDPTVMETYCSTNGLMVLKRQETEFAWILTAEKSRGA